MHIHDKEKKLLKYSTVYKYLDKQSIRFQKTYENYDNTTCTILVGHCGKKWYQR